MLTLPVEADYDAVDKILQAAHDAVEQLVWRVSETLAAANRAVTAEDEPEATADHLAALWSFVSGLDLRITEFRGFHAELEQAVVRVDGLRLDQRRRDLRAGKVS